MPSVNKSALLPYSAAQVFALVDDIKRYPEFLPWCSAAEELQRGEDEVKASVHIAHKGIKKTFTTHNRHQHGKMIEMRLVQGPFKHLEGFWRFEELGESGSKVSLDLEFEFSSKLVAMAIGPIFHQIANTLVDAFCERARQVYG